MTLASYNLPALGGARVLVVGDLMLDRYYTGSTQRISPEAPVPVVNVSAQDSRPGGAANVAVNLARLGVQVSLIGLVGQDEAGLSLARMLEAHGIDAELLESASCPTITKLRVLSRHQQLIRLDFEQSFSRDAALERLPEVFRGRIAAADVVVLSDYAKGTLGQASELVAEARRAGCRVVVDPKGSDFSKYRGATVLTPNMSEFEAIAGISESEDALSVAAERLRADLALDTLLLTRSERGMSLYSAATVPVHLPARAREVFDVTGAGDTVVAVLAAGLATGLDAIHAARLANIAAGIVVGKLGTASVSVEELQQALGQSDSGDGGMLVESELLSRVAAARARGEVIVLTNGCFDVLHAGHVRYLKAARALGDLLIVAVNDDDSVRRLKGASRPLNSVADRMDVLASLECVDWVLPFSEDTPARLIGQVLPDILVKGGDYQPDQIAGGDAVVAAGGEVVCLDFHAGYSTTSLIDRARGTGQT